MNRVLVTGASGFVGCHLVKELLDKGMSLVCIDNFNSYYDVSLKVARKKYIVEYSKTNKIPPGNLIFIEQDISDKDSLEKIFQRYNISSICHLAAQAGVRYSIKNPYTYIQNNIVATLNLLELSKDYNVKDFVFASTSSVYGLTDTIPFKESSITSTPISTYSASKSSCEQLCHVYHNLYGIRFRILRFFTVYGPWGRPDMSYYKFTKAILDKKPIDVYNNGQMERDFTYVSDIARGFSSALTTPLDYEIINLGSDNPIKLLEFINVIEEIIGWETEKIFLPLQAGDVISTWADISKAKTLLNYKPQVDIRKGLGDFVKWYKSYTKYNLIK